MLRSRRGPFRAARTIIREGLADQAFPAAVVSVGGASGPRWEEAFGTLTYAYDAPQVTLDTIFDLASLTKVIATASIAMHLVESGRLALDTPVGEILPRWNDEAHRHIRVRHLLDHSSGLPAHARFWTSASGRRQYEDALHRLALERAPGSAAVYSDAGFMLLGFVLEAAGNASLDRQFDARWGERDGTLRYLPRAGLLDRVAPTERDSWRGRVLQGEVHDENTAALGGVAAHAGLFGTAPAVGSFARCILQTFKRVTALASPDTMRVFATCSQVPGSSRALAWDTALPTSSSGTRMSASAIGHTGFTGTSLWIDVERDLYAVLLTNRVHPSRENDKLRPLRAAFHDALPD